MKPGPLDMALGKLMGFREAVMDKNLQRLAAKKHGAAPGMQAPQEGDEGHTPEELARLLEQYGRGC